MIDLLSLTERYQSFTVMSGKDFLLRARNNFDTGIPLVITGESNLAIRDKIEDFFGDVNIEENDGYIIVEPKSLFEKTRYSFGDLVEVIRRLRDPDGCQWDRKQSPKTIRTNIVEEAYELTEAIDLDDDEKMREECGDVMLQGIFCAVMTGEENRFNVNDVVSDLCKKLITRHTHIFGKDKATDAQQALMFWEKAKALEKGQKTVADKLDAVPRTFTALQRANKVQKIIKKTGFEFPDEKDAIAKIYEEVKEFIDAEGTEREKEAGDMLFSVVNVLRMNGIDPEVALLNTTSKFEKRFRFVIEELKKIGKTPEESNLDEMEELYNKAKKTYK